MTLSEDIEEFRGMISRLVEQLEEVSNSSRTVPTTDADNRRSSQGVAKEK